MKRIRILVAAVALVMGVSSTAYAQLPFDNGEQGLIIVGDRAYSIEYLTRLDSNLDIKAINDRIAQNHDRVFYMDTQGNIKNAAYMNSNSTKSESILGVNEMLYTGVSGQTLYVFNRDIKQYEEKQITAKARVMSSQLGTLRMLKITIKPDSIKNLNDYEIGYFKLEDSSEMTPIGSTINYMINTPRDEQKITIYSKDKRPIASGNLNVSLTYGNTIEREFNLIQINDSASSKAVGNINNNGLSDIDNDLVWTYYSNTGDKGYLYKIKADGMENVIVATDEAKYINVVNDWVYYSNYSDGGKLYRVKTNGTKKEKLCDDMAAYINVVGDYAYFSNGSEGGNIFKINIKAEKPEITKVKLTNDMAAFINVDKDKIYYSNYSDNKKIYTMNLDGGSRVAMPDTDGAMFITLQGNFIYYTNYLEGGKPYKIAKGTNIKTKISDDKTTAINLNGAEIYFTNYADNKYIYKINSDGSGKELLIKDSADYITVSGYTIFYSKAGKLFKVEYTVDANGKKVLGNPVAVSKSKDKNKIAKINPLIDNVKFKEEAEPNNYKFPEMIYAIMSDGSTKPVTVVWDKDKYSKKDNIYVYKGTVLGYNNKVTLTVGVTSSKGININDVIVINNAPENGSDTIEVRGLGKGDEVFAYYEDPLENKDTERVYLGLPAEGSSFVKKDIKLNSDGGSLWVTVKRAKGPKDKVNPTESVPLKVDYLAETNVPNYIAAEKPLNQDGANDTIVFKTLAGLQPGDVIKIYRNQNDTVPINTEESGKVVNPSNELKITGLDFSEDDFGDKTLWFSVTGQGKTESIRKETQKFDDSPSVAAVKEAAKESNKADIISKIKFATAEGTNSVKSNFTLPTSYQGCIISWKSDKTDNVTISNADALVKRPDVGKGDAKVKLIPVFTKGRASLEGPAIDINVIAMAEEELIASDMKNLESQISYTEGDNKDSVTGDILLPIKGVNGSDITWTLNPPTSKYASLENKEYSTIVKINRPENGEGPRNITLQAELKYKNKVQTKDIEITIKPKTGSIEFLDAAAKLLMNKYDGMSISQDEIDLLSKVEGQDGVKVEWQPELPIVLKYELGKYTEKATVIRPSFVEGDVKDVNLVAILSDANNSSLNKKVVMKVNILHKQATDSEAVQIIGKVLSSYIVRIDGSQPEDNVTKLYLPQDSSDTKLQGANEKIKELDGTNGPKANIKWSIRYADGTIVENPTITNGEYALDTTKKGKVTVLATITSDNGKATWNNTFTFTIK